MSLLDQIVSFGSVLDAIDNKKISCQELINYLIEHKSDLAYEKQINIIVCLLKSYPINCYYYGDLHLLNYYVDDKLVLLLFFLSNTNMEYFNLPLSKLDADNLIMFLFLDIQYELKLSEKSNEFYLASLLSDFHSTTISTWYKNNHMNFSWLKNTLFLCRCSNVVIKIFDDSKELYREIIETDWFEKYPPEVFEWLTLIIKRFKSLKESAPIYALSVKGNFVTLLEEVTPKQMENIKKDELIEFYDSFPEQFSSNPHLFPEEYFYLSIYPPPIQAYILGLPIQENVPTLRFIEEKVKELIEVGKDKYLTKIVLQEPLEAINSENTLGDYHHLYHKFDRYEIEQNGKIYRFTRQEFPELLNKKTNFWNKCPISNIDLLNLKIRQIISDTLKLPPADTSENLLDLAMKGELYKEVKVSNNSSTQETFINPLQMLNILQFISGIHN